MFSTQHNRCFSSSVNQEHTQAGKERKERLNKVVHPSTLISFKYSSHLLATVKCYFLN